MATTGQTPTFQRDTTEGAGTYHALSKEKIAYSVPLSDLVIADYDASGAVRGLEFVGKQSAPLETFLELARKASRRTDAQSPRPDPGDRQKRLTRRPAAISGETCRSARPAGQPARARPAGRPALGRRALGRRALAPRRHRCHASILAAPPGSGLEAARPPRRSNPSHSLKRTLR